MTSPESNPNDPLNPLTDPNNSANTYIRWRPRMVRQSVYNDMVQTLLRAGWPILEDGVRLDVPASQFQVSPINIIEYVPEEGFGQDNPLLPNTLALDNGLPGPMEEAFLGGPMERPYRFQYAFYAENDAVAQALLSDLYDRYMGLADSPFITLFNYASATPTPVVRMEVETFQYTRAPDSVAAWERQLFLAVMELTDYVRVSERKWQS